MVATEIMAFLASGGIVAGFISTWSYISSLSSRVGNLEGSYEAIHQKVDLMFGKMFDGENISDDEIIKLKRRTKEIEKNLGISRET